MTMFEKAEYLVQRQLKKAKVVLSYQDEKVSIACENASMITYGYVIYDILSVIAERNPEMIPMLRIACNNFLENVRCEDETI